MTPCYCMKGRGGVSFFGFLIKMVYLNYNLIFVKIFKEDIMEKQVLIIINDAPYGTEKAYNGLRLANQLLKDNTDLELVVFLMADAATCAIPGQKTPNGFYNIERMLKALVMKSGRIKVCTSCAEARGIHDIQLVEGAELSTMSELAKLTVNSDRVITF